MADNLKERIRESIRCLFCYGSRMGMYRLPDSNSRHVFCEDCDGSGPWGETNEEAQSLYVRPAKQNETIDDIIKWLKHKEVAARDAETATEKSRTYFDAKMQSFSEVVEHLEIVKRGRAVLTIGDCVDGFGFTLCPKCGARRTVDAIKDRGRVAACTSCGDTDYWNLFVSPAV